MVFNFFVGACAPTALYVASPLQPTVATWHPSELCTHPPMGVPDLAIGTLNPHRRCRCQRAWRFSSSYSRPQLGKKPCHCLPCARTSFRWRALAAARKRRPGEVVEAPGGGSARAAPRDDVGNWDWYKQCGKDLSLLLLAGGGCALMLVLMAQ